VDDCAVNRCQNGGSCVDKVNGFKCICPAGFTGPLCQTDIDDCQTDNPCLNGGSCADLVNSFRCLCVPGFTGSLCQTNVDDCLTKPCSNGGQCHDLINDYRCTCKPGFAGKDCSSEVNECSARPCLNGGTCLDRINEYKCLCPRGYSGLRCERSAAQKLNATVPTVLGSASRLGSTASTDASLSVAQIVMIATISTAVPLIAIVSCLVIVCLKKRRQKEQLRSDEEARRQNEQNVVHSISKKMDKMDKCLEEHRIINTLDFPSQSKGKSINEPELYAVVPATKETSSAQQQQQYKIHRTSKALNVETFNDKLVNSSSSSCQSNKEVMSSCEPTYVTLDKRLSVTPTCSSSPR
jgi:Golgi apparatus protein 1